MKGSSRKRVTLQQVADHAGVSRATASLVVRGRSNVSEATRERVQESIRILGYVYDRVAANLRSQRSTTVGVMITEIANPYFAEFLKGVHQALDQEGYTVILGTTFDSAAKQDQLLSTMLEYRVGGVIMSPVSGSSPDLVMRLQQWNIPVILASREMLIHDSYDYVGINNLVGSKLAVEHLIEQGHRKIAFIGGDFSSSAWKQRKQGYSEVFSNAGLAWNESYFIAAPTTRQGGLKAIKEIFSLTDRPTAAFCYNDIVAFGVMNGLEELGRRPGVDFSVVGFDDIQEASLSTPSLTTIKAFPELIGAHAAELLHQRMTNTADSLPRRVILTPELVVRNSSAFYNNI